MLQNIVTLNHFKVKVKSSPSCLCSNVLSDYFCVFLCYLLLLLCGVAIPCQASLVSGWERKKVKVKGVVTPHALPPRGALEQGHPIAPVELLSSQL